MSQHNPQSFVNKTNIIADPLKGSCDCNYINYSKKPARSSLIICGQQVALMCHVLFIEAVDLISTSTHSREKGRDAAFNQIHCDYP